MLEVSVSTGFLLEFRTVTTMSYFCIFFFLIFLIENEIQTRFERTYKRIHAENKEYNTYSGSNNLYYNTTSATSGEVAAYFSGAL